MIDTVVSTFFALISGGASAAALELLKGVAITSVNKGLQVVQEDSVIIAEQLIENPQDKAAKQQLQPMLEEIIQAYPEFGQQIQELHQTSKQTTIHKVESKKGIAMGEMSGGTINFTAK